jgi:hypothetical protein
MKKFLVISILFFSLFLLQRVFAQECPPPFQCVDVPLCTSQGGICHSEYKCDIGCCCEFPSAPTPTIPRVGELVEEVINFVINIVMMFAGVIMMVGGYFMITSAGDPNQFEKGKRTLIYGGVGFFLVLIARVLADEIMKMIQ